MSTIASTQLVKRVTELALTINGSSSIGLVSGPRDCGKTTALMRAVTFINEHFERTSAIYVKSHPLALPFQVLHELSCSIQDAGYYANPNIVAAHRLLLNRVRTSNITLIAVDYTEAPPLDHVKELAEFISHAGNKNVPVGILIAGPENHEVWSGWGEYQPSQIRQIILAKRIADPDEMLGFLKALDPEVKILREKYQSDNIVHDAVDSVFKNTRGRFSCLLNYWEMYKEVPNYTSFFPKDLLKILGEMNKPQAVGII